MAPDRELRTIFSEFIRTVFEPRSCERRQVACGNAESENHYVESHIRSATSDGCRLLGYAALCC